MTHYIVRYQAGPYEGVEHVYAEDADHAIAIAKARVRKRMTLPMYSESYKVVDTLAE